MACSNFSFSPAHFNGHLLHVCVKCGRERDVHRDVHIENAQLKKALGLATRQNKDYLNNIKKLEKRIKDFQDLPNPYETILELREQINDLEIFIDHIRKTANQALEKRPE